MNIEQVRIFSSLLKDLKIAVALPFSIIGLLSISPITFAQPFAYEPFGDAVYSNFYQNVGFFYIYDVTLQATIVPEFCRSGSCPQEKGVDVILSTNTPSCPNGSLEGWVSVTFTSEDNKAHFKKNFEFLGKKDENNFFSRQIHVDGYYADLNTGNVSVETSARCVKSLLPL